MPLLFDGPYLKVLKTNNLPDDTPIPIQIGGTDISLKGNALKREVKPDAISNVLDDMFKKNRRRRPHA